MAMDQRQETQAMTELRRENGQLKGQIQELPGHHAGFLRGLQRADQKDTGEYGSYSYVQQVHPISAGGLRESQI